MLARGGSAAPTWQAVPSVTHQQLMQMQKIADVKLGRFQMKFKDLN